MDGRELEVDAGQTILQAARGLGIDIPTLCHLEACGPMTSCLVCVVKVRSNGPSRVVPSCATPIRDGMDIESESDEVRTLRRTALELLLSDHVGDCLSPCHRICPLELNIPQMIRQIELGQPAEAIATVRQALPLPGVLGRLCHAPCQKGCRRESCDGSAAIQDLERHVADRDRESGAAWLPARMPATGKHAAIVGSGPAGLAVANHLLRQGHDCTLFDRQPHAGGSMRGVPGLPVEVLDFEIRQLERLGARFRLSEELGRTVTLADLERLYDAVIVAVGEIEPGAADRFGMLPSPTGLRTHLETGQTASAKVFVAGSAVRPLKQLVRVLAEAQATAEGVHQVLSGLPIRRSPKAFSSMMGRLEETELDTFLKSASAGPRVVPSGGPSVGYTVQEARCEAGRCLHCDCRAAGHCALQRYAALYGASTGRFGKQRRRFSQELHPGNVFFESGKCILCGICIEIAQQAAEPLGLTFVGRGFDVRVAAPLGHSFAEGLQKAAEDCVTHCPTGAITFREGKTQSRQND